MLCGRQSRDVTGSLKGPDSLWSKAGGMYWLGRKNKALLSGVLVMREFTFAFQASISGWLTGAKVPLRCKPFGDRRKTIEGAGKMCYTSVASPIPEQYVTSRNFSESLGFQKCVTRSTSRCNPVG